MNSTRWNSHAGKREAIGRSALVVAHQAVYLPDIIRHIPWAVVSRAFHGREERTVADTGRSGCKAAAISETAEAHFCNVLRKFANVVDFDRTSRAEVADVGVVRPLADIHRPDQFRDEEIDVSIALSVAVSGHVDRHTVQGDGKISAVIEIEAAQKVLVGLALAGVLGDDQARNDFQRLAGPREGHCIDLGPGEADRAGGRGLQVAGSFG